MVITNINVHIFFNYLEILCECSLFKKINKSIDHNRDMNIYWSDGPCWFVCVYSGGGELRPVEGNPQRSVWKVCCWRMAEEVRKLKIMGLQGGARVSVGSLRLTK